MSWQTWRFVSAVLCAACSSPPPENAMPRATGESERPGAPSVLNGAPRAAPSTLAAPSPVAASSSASALPEDPALAWLQAAASRSVGAADSFDAGAGVRYTAYLVSLRDDGADDEELQVAKLLCVQDAIVDLLTRIMKQREMFADDPSSCSDGHGTTRCVVPGWHDAPDYAIELERRTATTYRLVSIHAVSRAAIGPEFVERADAWTRVQDRALRARRCASKPGL